MTTVALPQGTLQYRDEGSGPPIVFLHGYLMDGRLWAPIVERLRGQFRCITPDLPMGAHRIAMRADVEMTSAWMARLVADFITALDLADVTLVGNDSGGAIAQVVAARHPGRLGRLVLTPCDAFDNYPPRMFRWMGPLAKAHGLSLLLVTLKVRPIRELPIAMGWLARTELPHELVDSWISAYFSDREVRRDARRYTMGIGPDAFMLQIAEELGGFEQPVLLAWAVEDKFFPFAHAERLAAILPNARVERIERSRTLVMVDQPDRTASLIQEFVHATIPATLRA